MSDDHASIGAGLAGRASTEVRPSRIDVYTDVESAASTVREDIRKGLTSRPKFLLPKYFYDATGSALFERITQLPEYYLTRVEQGIIESVSDELMERVRPREVIELGPGSITKIRALLEAPGAESHAVCYVPFDVDERVVRDAVEAVLARYPYLDAHGLVGDFETHLDKLPPALGRRLIAFFGSTIGNLGPEARRELLTRIRGHMTSGDRLLLGVDLVKDPAILEAAYNDPGGVTEQFNRNILSVVNGAVGADFQPEAFEHRAYYDPAAQRIEMHLAPSSIQTVDLRDLDLVVEVRPGETIWTESSYKFTEESNRAMLEGAGLAVDAWHTDDSRLFALVLAGPE